MAWEEGAGLAQKGQHNTRALIGLGQHGLTGLLKDHPPSQFCSGLRVIAVHEGAHRSGLVNNGLITVAGRMFEPVDGGGPLAKLRVEHTY